MRESLIAVSLWLSAMLLASCAYLNPITETVVVQPDGQQVSEVRSYESGFPGWDRRIDTWTRSAKGVVLQRGTCRTEPETLTTYCKVQ